MLQLQVERIQPETADTATFFLREISGQRVYYEAGQFITLVFEHHHEEIRRSYSLSSSPHEPLLAITIKRIANGEISRYMFTKVKPADILKAEKPAGRFILPPQEQHSDVILFAAGSGITPVFSQLKWLLNSGSTRKAVLIYSSIDEQSIIFKQALDALALAHPRQLQIVYLLSSNTDRLNNIMVERLVKQYAAGNSENTGFYICGPFTYMRMVKLTLLYMGIPAQHIRKENFVVDTLSVSPTPINYAPQSAQIHYRDEVFDIVVGENQSILQAALQNKIKLQYSCREGVCSACAVKCLSGKVIMARNDVLTDADMTEGWVLTCTGHPVTPVVIDAGH